ncbi:MAG: pseudouridine-5'-phosphate glycosidase [Acidobacteria bacterium]|nr:pseudouridine-5'-phosphate glycosidase [Acidobacteriota bacterium]
MSNRHLLKLSAEVEAALDERRAVVALESTVIAHGLPRPQNFETAQRLEQIVRESEATPATIAVLKGKLCVGLSSEELRHLAESDGILKVSRRDLPVVIARGLDGATTVATTMWIVRQAGIRVFATGGIGGVHRGSLPDVSADLPELARTQMLVVCSGAKIVLDLPATREWLETHGVTVVGYKCEELPAFYSSTSGLPVDSRADSADEAARIVIAREQLNLEGATLLAVPVPADAEVPSQLLQETLDEALHEAESQAIGGRDLTPFLLSRMAARSGGATLRANISLLANNARVASEVAIALSSST